MKEIFNKITLSSMLMSFILILLGLILIFYPSISLNSFGLIVGIYLILEGIHLVYLDVTSKFVLISIDTLLPGILSILFGCMLVVRPYAISTILTFVIGTWIIAKSINSLKFSVDLIVNNKEYILLLILSILEIVLGVLMFLNPVVTSISAVTFTGIILIFYSIINIVEMIMFRKNVKDFSKVLKIK
jgi:uncharacterized membrane protein HdeD (DUF308 family)